MRVSERSRSPEARRAASRSPSARAARFARRSCAVIDAERQTRRKRCGPYDVVACRGRRWSLRRIFGVAVDPHGRRRPPTIPARRSQWLQPRLVTERPIDRLRTRSRHLDFNLHDRRQRRIIREDVRQGGHQTVGRWRSNDIPTYGVLDIAAKKERRLVRNGDFASWSPDGRQIAFRRCRSQGAIENCFVYVMRSDGTKQRRLFRGEFPAWSPNGQELVFVSSDRRRGYADAVIRARVDGSSRRVLYGQKPVCGCVAPDWGPPPRRVSR